MDKILQMHQFIQGFPFIALQINVAHLENYLHETREEAQSYLHAADCMASGESVPHTSAIEVRRLFERLKSCVSSAEMTGFSDALLTLAQSLSK